MPMFFGFNYIVNLNWIFLIRLSAQYYTDLGQKAKEPYTNKIY